MLLAAVADLPLSSPLPLHLAVVVELVADRLDYSEVDLSRLEETCDMLDMTCLVPTMNEDNYLKLNYIKIDNIKREKKYYTDGRCESKEDV